MMDVARVHQASLSFSFSSAPSETTSEAAPITSATPIAPTSATLDPRDVAEALQRRRPPRPRGRPGSGAWRPISPAPRPRPWSRASRRRPASSTATLLALGVDRERRAHRLAARLAVDLDHVVARLGAEGDAAAEAVRDAERADAGAAGALLAPGLGGRSSRPRRGSGSRPCPGAARRGRRGPPRATSEWWKGSAKSSFGQVGLGRLAEHGRFSHRSSPRPSRCASPGTEPLTSSRLRSASTSATSRPFWVTRLLPIWPGIRIP